MIFSDLVVDYQFTPPVSDINVCSDEVSVLNPQPFQDLPWHRGQCQEAVEQQRHLVRIPGEKCRFSKIKPTVETFHLKSCSREHSFSLFFLNVCMRSVISLKASRTSIQQWLLSICLMMLRLLISVGTPGEWSQVWVKSVRGVATLNLSQNIFMKCDEFTSRPQ